MRFRFASVTLEEEEYEFRYDPIDEGNASADNLDNSSKFEVFAFAENTNMETALVGFEKVRSTGDTMGA